MINLHRRYHCGKCVEESDYCLRVQYFSCEFGIYFEGLLFKNQSLILLFTR
jgi:hypothetical protein